MYNRKSWGGSVDPFILLKFVKPEEIPDGEDPIVSLVIFEWKDRNLVGKQVTEESNDVSSRHGYPDEPAPLTQAPYSAHTSATSPQ